MKSTVFYIDYIESNWYLSIHKTPFSTPPRLNQSLHQSQRKPIRTYDGLWIRQKRNIYILNSNYIFKCDNCFKSTTWTVYLKQNRQKKLSSTDRLLETKCLTAVIPNRLTKYDLTKRPHLKLDGFFINCGIPETKYICGHYLSIYCRRIISPP